MSKIFTWIRHNQGVFAGLVLSVVLLIWTYGCESKVTSLTEPTLTVTRAELDLEVEQLTASLDQQLDLLMKQAALRYQDLDKQDAMKQKLFDFTAMVSHSGEINGTGVLALIMGLLGSGVLVDNRIKDKVIKNRPVGGNSGKV